MDANFLEPSEEIASGGKEMNTETEHGKAETRKESGKAEYDKDRMDEFLLDAIMHKPEPGSDDIPDIIFVDDEPLYLNSTGQR